MRGCSKTTSYCITTILLALFTLCVFIPCPALSGQKSSNSLSPQQLAAVIDARNFIEQGKPKRAVSTLSKLTKSRRPPLIILSHLAWAQTETGDNNAAFNTYRRAAELYPEDAETVRNFGIILLKQDHLTEAADTLVRAYGLQTKDAKEAPLLALAASALIQKEYYAKALPLLKQAGQDSGDMQVNWASLAVYCCIQLGRTEEAVQYSRDCTRHHPESAEAWSLLSRALMRDEAPLAAAAALETAFSINESSITPHPMNESAAVELAALYARGHANAEAAQRLMQSGMADSATRAARYHYLAGRYEAALLMLDSHPPTDGLQGIQLLRRTVLKGRILINLDRPAEAVSVLKTTTTMSTPPADRDAANRLRGTALLLAGQALWQGKRWAEAATNFDALATIPGYGNTGASLARAMRALIREATEKVRFSASN